jgi:hypothetical protein
MLWEWILIIFSALIAWTYRDRHHDLMPWVLAFSPSFLRFLAVIALLQPVETIFPVPPMAGLIRFSKTPTCSPIPASLHGVCQSYRSVRICDRSLN